MRQNLYHWNEGQAVSDISELQLTNRRGKDWMTILILQNTLTFFNRWVTRKDTHSKADGNSRMVYPGPCLIIICWQKTKQKNKTKKTQQLQLTSLYAEKKNGNLRSGDSISFKFIWKKKKKRNKQNKSKFRDQWESKNPIGKTILIFLE